MHYIYKVNYAPIVIVKRSSQFKDLLLILIVDMHLNYLHQNFITYFIPQRIATKIFWSLFFRSQLPTNLLYFSHYHLRGSDIFL